MSEDAEATRHRRIGLLQQVGTHGVEQHERDEPL